MEGQNLGVADMKPPLPRDPVSLLTGRTPGPDGTDSGPAPPQLQSSTDTFSGGGPDAGTENTSDSLNLMQLRKIVTELPKVEATPYAFTYSDAASLPEEIEEWFTYGVEGEGKNTQNSIEFRSGMGQLQRMGFSRRESVR